MALTYRTDTANQMALITCHGRVPGAEWRTCLRSLAAEGQLAAGWRILVDARNLTGAESDVVVAILGGLTTWFAELGGATWAILAREQTSTEGLARRLTVHATRMGVRMVTNPQDADCRVSAPRFRWQGRRQSGS